MSEIEITPGVSSILQTRNGVCLWWESPAGAWSQIIVTADPWGAVLTIIEANEPVFSRYLPRSAAERLSRLFRRPDVFPAPQPEGVR